MTHQTLVAMTRAYLAALNADGVSAAIVREPEDNELAAMLAALQALADLRPSGEMVLAADEVHYLPQPAPDPTRLPRMRNAIQMAIVALVEECSDHCGDKS